MNRWHLTITDPEATFKEIETNGGGKILFDEFCHWVVPAHLNLDSYDGEYLLAI
jgi:hypothetical protein